MGAEKIFHTLIVDDDPTVAMRFQNVFAADQNIIIESALSGPEAIQKVKATPYKFATVFVDVRMPSMKGDEVTRELLKINPRLIIAMNSADTSRESLKNCIRAGAVDFILKPLPNEELQHNVELRRQVFSLCKKFEEVGETLAENEPSSQQQELITSVKMAGASDKLAQTSSIIHRAAMSDCNVLITGEPGTGKELAIR